MNNREVAVQSKLEYAEQSRIKHHLGVSQSLLGKNVTDLFESEDSEEDDKNNNAKKRRMI